MQRKSAESRREFLKAGGLLAAGTALGALSVPRVHAAGSDEIRLALIGSGGRGSGAIGNAIEATGSTCKLWAMADLFDARLNASHKALSNRYKERIDVPPERRFLGFDAYRRAIDSLRPGDIAVLATYPAFRVVHLDYAVSKGVHVFMEKSFATDPVGVRRVIAAGEEAERKNVKIAAGVMCRHSRNRQELIRRIQDGQLGDILTIRACRMEGSGPLGPRRPDEKELLYQIRNSVRFLWVSGGLWAEMDIHQIDEICWLKNDVYPVSAHGVGGRAFNNADRGQNLDSFSAEWTFPDGAKAFDVVRYIPGCYPEFATYVHGTKCAAQFSGAVHAGTVRIFKDQRIANDNVAWEAPKEEFTAWQSQWNDFLAAIRENRPFNQARRAALSNLTDIMGRAAIHMGRIVTWDESMASKFQWCPNIDSMTDDTPPPATADANGQYPVPVPGKWTEI